MQKYRDVISKVLANKPIIDQNICPNTDLHTQRQMDEIIKIRKVNFKLQDDKAQLIEQLKGLRSSYIKYKNLKEAKDTENKKLKSQLASVKQKLIRTETINHKLQKRLYSNKKSISQLVSSRGDKTQRTQRTQKAISTKYNSNYSTDLPISKPVQYSVSVQTQPKQVYTIACQTDFEDKRPKVKKQQPRFIKQKFDNLIDSINLIQSEKVSTYSTDKTSFRTSTDEGLTQRHTGRIVSGRRKKMI